jgi:hypothetical protein
MDDTTRGVDDESTTRRAQPARGGSSASGRSTRAKRAPAADTDKDAELDRATDARTRELQAEIAETREELSETVEAIQEKLRPSHMMSEGTEALKTAATERVRDMADTATYTAQRFVESTRENIWPAILIGSGVAWLLIDRSRESRRFDSGRYRTARYQSARYGTGASAYQVRTGTAGRMSSDDDDDTGYNVDMRTGGRSYRNAISNGQNGLQRMLHDNPLLVAAGAVLMGAAVGGALPQTEKENELMGEARDQMMQRAQGAAREAADSVRDVASAVQHAANQVSEPSQH